MEGQDREALARRLVDTYSDQLLRLAYSLLNNVPDAQDVCQVALLNHSDDVIRPQAAFIVNAVQNAPNDGSLFDGRASARLSVERLCKVLSRVTAGLLSFFRDDGNARRFGGTCISLALRSSRRCHRKHQGDDGQKCHQTDNGSRREDTALTLERPSLSPGHSSPSSAGTARR